MNQLFISKAASAPARSRALRPIAFLALAALLCAALFSACGQKLPEGMTEDAVSQAAADTLALLNAQDYDALVASMDDTMREALTAERLKEVWEPAAAEAGAYVSTESTSVVGQKGYGVAVVQAKYENKTLVFTFSYTPEYLLGGLYFK